MFLFFIFKISLILILGLAPIIFIVSAAQKFPNLEHLSKG